MNKIKLKELIKRYQKEVKYGDMSHFNDLIASMVISDLTEVTDSYMTLYSVDEITLSKLLGQINPELVSVPSRYEINDEKSRFNALSKSRALIYGYEQKKAANTWIDMMIDAGIIKENETINPVDYVLDDFIKDYNLREILPIKYTRKKDNTNNQIVKGKGLNKNKKGIN